MWDQHWVNLICMLNYHRENCIQSFKSPQKAVHFFNINKNYNQFSDNFITYKSHSTLSNNNIKRFYYDELF